MKNMFSCNAASKVSSGMLFMVSCNAVSKVSSWMLFKVWKGAVISNIA